MKVMGFNEEGQPTLVDISKENTKSDEFIKAAERVFLELQSWRAYRQMGEKYAKTVHQKFEHFLVTLDDLFSLLKESKELDAHEKNEFKRLMESISE